MSSSWLILSGICILAAAAFLLRGQFDAAFVAAVIGLVSWFLNYRAQVTQSLAADEQQKIDEQKGEDDSDEDEPMEN